ncbi:hypothetical protein MLD38_021345 [Melastoma candidum]|uniref:Uncharacterized protein n=1 Tax=Melastoma candidum TaxID=119954 RepID=A0ACB9QF81_9MYRT|nr:hypothetical protein MLD38_021345 [Melastoma candidum]
MWSGVQSAAIVTAPRRLLQAEATRHFEDEGDWSYSSEWWGATSPGDGHTLFRSVSDMGNESETRRLGGRLSLFDSGHGGGSLPLFWPKNFKCLSEVTTSIRSLNSSGLYDIAFIDAYTVFVNLHTDSDVICSQESSRIEPILPMGESMFTRYVELIRIQ